jgi:MFS transporter, UMF1 family
MGLIPPDWTVAFITLFFLTSLCFELSFSFYNGFLPEISDEASMNRISGYGFAAGYLGGGLALLVAILVFRVGSGLPRSSSAIRRSRGNRRAC